MSKSTTKTDDAPKRARRDDKDGEFTIVGRSVLINRPRDELFAYWSDFTNLPSFMTSLERVEVMGERSRWHIKAPAGQTVTIEAVTEDVVSGRAIGWRSTEESPIATKGRVTFNDAPAERGTIVTLEIAYEPPAGDIGRLVAKLFAAEPNIQARHELKRFKMLMETGEIAFSPNHRSEEEEAA